LKVQKDSAEKCLSASLRVDLENMFRVMETCLTYVPVTL